MSLTPNSYYKYLSNLILGLCILLLSACEYDGDNMNYHNLTPPDQSTIVDLNLSDIPDGNTIYVYSPTSIKYAINTSSGTILEKQFYLNEQPINSQNGTIYLSPNNLPENKTSTLKLKVKITSDSKSLAEMLGKEKSEFEMSYPVKYVDPDINLNIKQRINTNNHLELYWDKPELEGVEIESYKIYYYNDFNNLFAEEITNPDKTTFEDKDYVYGNKTYRIVTKYISDKIPEKEDFYTIQHDELTNDGFITSSSESFKLKISWNNPSGVAAKYVFVWKGQVIYVENGKNEVSVLRPTFPMTGAEYYQLYILPTHVSFHEYSKYSKIVNYFEEGVVKDSHGNYAPITQYVADIKNGYIIGMDRYVSNFSLQIYDKDNLKLVGTTNTTKPSYYSAENLEIHPTTGVAGIQWGTSLSGDQEEIYVFSDYTLKTRLGAFAVEDDDPVFSLTDENIFFRTYMRRHCMVYNIQTGEFVKKIEDDDWSQFRTATSSDGNYIFNYLRIDDTWFKFYKYDDGNLTLLKHQIQSGVTKIVFNPYNDKHVLMQNNNGSFTILELPSLTKIKTIQGILSYIDPYTGKILYISYDSSGNITQNILDKSYEKVILSLTPSNKGDAELRSHLINDYLIVDNYYVNVAK